MSDEVILGTRAKAGIGHKTYRVKMVGNRVYVEWGAWHYCGNATSGSAAIKQAEAFLANRR